MSIKRYIANKDTTITNAFKYNMVDRGVDSNMGESDILEVFSIYGQANTSSLEASRILVQFPIADIITDRNNKKIGNSGSVEFILKLSNAPHGDSVPSQFNLIVAPLSRSWVEGFGIDMEGYTDIGVANWLTASNSNPWTNAGGDVVSPEYNIFLDVGTENLEVNITDLVEKWIDSTIQNNGLLIKLSGTQEQSTDSYYTKKFFARGSEFFYKRPWIEARTNDSLVDNRSSFIISSSLLEEENLNKLVFYNRHRGVLRNIPSVGSGSDIYVSLYAGVTQPTGPALQLSNGNTKVQAGFYKTGIYTASVAVNTTSSYLFDIWFSGSTAENSNSTIFGTGSVIVPMDYIDLFSNEKQNYVLSMPNLKSSYSNKEIANFRIHARDKDWSPNIYTVASKEVEKVIIDDLYYKILRIQDFYEVIPYGTGSYKHTKVSSDVDGHYFELDIGLLEKGYSYSIKLGHFYGNDFYELDETFKFRVE